MIVSTGPMHAEDVVPLFTSCHTVEVLSMARGEFHTVKSIETGVDEFIRFYTIENGARPDRLLPDATMFVRITL